MTRTSAPTLFFAVSVALATRVVSAVPLTFAETAHLAETGSPTAAAARARTETTRRGEDVAGMIPNPTVVVGSYVETSRLYAAVSVPLPIWGQIGLARDAARVRTDEASANERTARLEATLAALSGWTDVWLAHSTVRAAHENAARLEVLARGIDELVAAGQRPRMDALGAHSELAVSRADEEAASRALLAARIELGARLGLISRSDDDLPDVAGDPPVPTGSAGVDLGGGRSPAVDALDARARSAAADVRLEERLRIPTPSLLFGTYLFRATNPPTDFFVGLGFELPVFNQRGPLIAAARARESAARAEQAALTMQLRADARAATEQLEAASVRATTMSTVVLPAATEAADLARESYRAGRLDLAGLLAAEQRRLTAQVRADQSVADRTRAWLALARATGAIR